MYYPPLSLPAFYIMLALTNADRHGYEIMKQIELDSDETIKIGPATLYTTIKRLLRASFIVEREERPDPQLDDQRRRYYGLTSIGREAVLREVKRMQSAVHIFKLKKV